MDNDYDIDEDIQSQLAEATSYYSDPSRVSYAIFGNNETQNDMIGTYKPTAFTDDVEDDDYEEDDNHDPLEAEPTSARSESSSLNRRNPKFGTVGSKAMRDQLSSHDRGQFDSQYSSTSSGIQSFGHPLVAPLPSEIHLSPEQSGTPLAPGPLKRGPLTSSHPAHPKLPPLPNIPPPMSGKAPLPLSPGPPKQLPKMGTLANRPLPPSQSSVTSQLNDSTSSMNSFNPSTDSASPTVINTLPPPHKLSPVPAEPTRLPPPSFGHAPRSLSVSSGNLHQKTFPPTTVIPPVLKLPVAMSLASPPPPLSLPSTPISSPLPSPKVPNMPPPQSPSDSVNAVHVDGYTLPRGSFEGNLLLSSSLLPFVGWHNCQLSLIGQDLHWYCREVEKHGTIDLRPLVRIGKPKKSPDSLPAGTQCFALDLGGQKYQFAGSDQEKCAQWMEKIKSSLPKKKKKTVKKTSPSTIALQLIKSRMQPFTSKVREPTFQLLQLLFDGKFTFIKAVFETTQAAEADKIAGGLARMFFYADRALHLVKMAINWEVQRTSNMSQLFRQDSISSKIMTAYTRLIAQPYLLEVLKTSVLKIIHLGSRLEVNPDVLPPSEKAYLPSRQELLQNTISELLQDISQSVSRMPTECRLICTFLSDAVTKKFNNPRSTEIAIGGYLFLRLINSAIVVPDGIGIVSSADLNSETRRALILVSKVLLNLANQVEFNKEPYLIPLNPFVRESLPIIQSFIKDVIHVPEGAPFTTITFPDPLMILDELVPVYKILFAQSSKITQKLGPSSEHTQRWISISQAIGPPPQTGVTQTTRQNHRRSQSLGSLDGGIPVPQELSHFVNTI